MTIPGAVILLHALFPRGKGVENPLRAQVDTVNAAIARLADGERVIYLDLGEKFLAADGGVDPKWMPDYLHPNEEGLRMWAASLRPYLERYLGKSSPDSTGALP